MVMEDGVTPGGQERLDRLDQGIPQLRMQFDGRPLFGVELTLLVQNLFGDLQLANVVEQRDPTQLLPILFGNL